MGLVRHDGINFHCEFGQDGHNLLELRGEHSVPAAPAVATARHQQNNGE